MGVAQAPHGAQVARRLQQHPGGALHQRLDHDRGDLVRVLREHLVERGHVARGHAVRVEQQRPVHRVEEVDAADRDRADRVAVVGVLEAHELGSRGLRLRGLLPVLERHLEGDLDGGRPAVGVEHPAQRPGAPVARTRRDRDQPPRQLLGARVGEAEHRGVGDAVQLLADRGVDVRVPVTVDVAPQRRHAVDVAAPCRVDEPHALGRLDRRCASSPSKPRICVNGCQTWDAERGAAETSRDGSLGPGRNPQRPPMKRLTSPRSSAARPARFRGGSRLAGRRDRRRPADGAVLRRVHDRVGEHDRRGPRLARDRLLDRRPLRRPPPSQAGALHARPGRGARRRR